MVTGSQERVACRRCLSWASPRPALRDLAPVYIASVATIHDIYHETIVKHFIENAIRPNPICTHALENAFQRFSRQGCVDKGFQCVDDPPLKRGISGEIF
jgi:hypothetical protein